MKQEGMSEVALSLSTWPFENALYIFFLMLPPYHSEWAALVLLDNLFELL